MTDQGLALAVALLAGLSCTGLIAAAFALPRRQDVFRRQLARIAEGAVSVASGNDSSSAAGSSQSVRETLREIEEAQRQRRRLTLRLRLRQAGLDWEKRHYAALVLGLGLAGLGLGYLSGLGHAVAGAMAVAAGIGIPELYLRLLRRRRLGQMSEEFPNAVDVIVRGVKSGLPFPDCLRIIARESREPLRSEFAKIVRDQAVGLPVDEAVDRFARRVPLSEANFFSIVIALQSETGGSLSEALNNLSTVLRERKKMRGKIRAMSSEAKASGGIIGSLPVVVSFIVYLTSPDYISLLFDTPTGNVVLAGSAVWMLIGVFVMRQMINFDF